MQIKNATTKQVFMVFHGKTLRLYEPTDVRGNIKKKEV